MDQIYSHSRWWWCLPFAAAALAFSSFYELGFLADARFLIADNLYLHDPAHVWDTLTHDYFWSSSGNSIPYWRPFTKLSWLLEAQLFGDWAGGYHLVQCLWLMVALAGILMLARELGLAPLYGAVAATLFALHPALVEPVCLIMARSDVTCTAGVIWAIATWLSWRKSRSGRALVLHCLALFVAFASKESAVVLIPLFVLWAALTGNHEDNKQRRYLLPLAPVFAVAVLYFLGRSMALSGQTTIALEWNFGRVFIGGSRYLLGLLPLQLESPVRNLSMAEAGTSLSWIVAGGLWLSAAGAAIFLLQKGKDKASVALILWAAGALAPVLLVAELNVPGVAQKYALADRWMMQSIAATSLVYVFGLRWLAQNYPRWGISVLIIGFAWLLVGLWKAPQTHAFYRSNESLASLEEQHFEETPEAFRTEQDRCRQAQRQVGRLLGKKRSKDAVATIKKMPEACRQEPLQAFNLLSALVQSRRFAEAADWVPQVLANPPIDRRFHGPMYLLCGITALARGNLTRAEHWLRIAQQLGTAGCDPIIQLAHAAVAQKEAALAATRFGRASECVGLAKNPQLALRAAYWWTQAKNAEKAAVWLSSVEAAVPLLGKLRQMAGDVEKRIGALKTNPAP